MVAKLGYFRAFYFYNYLYFLTLLMRNNWCELKCIQFMWREREFIWREWESSCEERESSCEEREKQHIEPSQPWKMREKKIMPYFPPFDFQ